MKKIFSGFIAGILITLSISSYAAVKLIANYSNNTLAIDGKYINTKLVNVVDGKVSKNYVDINAIAKYIGTIKQNGKAISIVRPTPKPTPTPTPTPLTVEEVAKMNLDNCVMINCYDSNGFRTGTGSGVVTEYGILTNKHVLDMGVKYGISFQWIHENEEYKTSKTVKLDTGLDIGLIETPTEVKSYAKFGDSDKVNIGEDIVLISSPNAMRNTVSKGIVSGIRTDYGMNHFQVSASAYPGSSGGGLFNTKSELIGILEKGANGEDHFVIRINEIIKILK